MDIFNPKNKNDSSSKSSTVYREFEDDKSLHEVQDDQIFKIYGSIAYVS
jgi:hypothetical protein